MDNRHHWQDVSTGALIGTGLGYFAYRQYYPPLSSPMSHRPYKSRTLRGKEHYTPINADPENGLHVHHWGSRAIAAEEDPYGHANYHPQSWHRPSASMSSGAPMAMTYPPHPNRFRRAEESEMDHESEAGGSVLDEERGIHKPVLSKSVKEIWREERERGER